jgi:hypothetical protein
MGTVLEGSKRLKPDTEFAWKDLIFFVSLILGAVLFFTLLGVDPFG